MQVEGLYGFFLAMALAVPAMAETAGDVPNAGRLAAYDRKLPQVAELGFNMQDATTLAAWPLSCIDHPQAAPEGAQYLWLYGQRPQLPVDYDKTRAFYGCYDWHSAVNSHWVMVALAKQYPELPLKSLIKEKLSQHLGQKNIEGEIAFFKQSKAFERPYGFAWLLKLHAELSTWDDPDAKPLAANLLPLRALFVDKLVSYYNGLLYASRGGVHPNTALSMVLVLDALNAVPDDKLNESVLKNAKRLFGKDSRCPTAYEPGGQEFLSPCLTEAQLMARVLPQSEYVVWVNRFLPQLDAPEFQTLAHSVNVSKITDKEDFAGKSHLIGLAFERGFAMMQIANALPVGDPRIPVLRHLAAINASEGEKILPEAGYLGSHWLATYAVLYLREAYPAHPPAANISMKSTSGDHIR
jgi:hypothetical protein